MTPVHGPLPIATGGDHGEAPGPAALRGTMGENPGDIRCCDGNGACTTGPTKTGAADALDC